MAFLEAVYESVVNNVVTGSETVFLEYADALSCGQAEASVTGLSEADTVAVRARCTLLAPVAPTGKIVQARDCSGVIVDPGSGFDVIVTTDNDGAPGTVTDGTTGGTAGDDPASTSDLSGETNVKFYKPSTSNQ